MYIDPNDPQAAALLQQAGLTIADDGTVIGGIEEAAVHQEAVQQDEVQQHQQQQIQQQQVQQQQSEVITSDPPAETQLGTIMEGAPENASTEVPQELFMSSDELESKTGLTLEAAEQKIVAEELGSTLVRTLLKIFCVIFRRKKLRTQFLHHHTFYEKINNFKHFFFIDPAS